MIGSSMFSFKNFCTTGSFSELHLQQTEVQAEEKTEHHFGLRCNWRNRYDLELKSFLRAMNGVSMPLPQKNESAYKP